MKNKHTTQDIPTGWESYGYSDINSYTNTQLSQGYSSLSSTWHELWFKTSRISPEVGPTQCKTCVASTHVCVYTCTHSIWYVHFYFCVGWRSVCLAIIYYMEMWHIYLVCATSWKFFICRYGLTTVVMLKHVTNQSEHTGLHKLLFHRR
jgi:hypothetical protein